MKLMPKMPKPPKIPKAPKVPDAAGGGKPAGGGLKAGARSFLRVFKPLLYLIPLAVAAVLVHYFAPHRATLWGYGVDPYFYLMILLAVLAGIVVLLVLLRLINYGLQRRRMKKQEAQTDSPEARRIAEGLLTRWEAVENLHRSAGVGLYDMPWYLVVGDPGADACPLLEGADLTFPESEKIEPLASDPDAVDQWYFSREAVFIDVAGRKRGADPETERLERDALMQLLAEKRPKCPINGVLLAVSAVDLGETAEDARRETARQWQDRLRSIFRSLQVRPPVYVTVVGMERLLGFTEFFADLTEAQRQGIFGWSDPNPPGAAVSVHGLTQALDEMVRTLDRQRFVRGGGGATEAAHRAAFFPEEFAALRGPVLDFVRVLFTRSRFEEPLFLRGVYFTGGADPAPPVSLYGKEMLPPALLESMARAEEHPVPRTPLFTRDLFFKKIFMERGLAARPGEVVRKNRKVKAAAAVLLGAAILLGGYYTVDFTRRTFRRIASVEADLNEARSVLATGRTSGDTLGLCLRLADRKQQLQHVGWLSRIIGMGRYEELMGRLGVVHRAVFQETQLTRILARTEHRLSRWTGERSRGGAGFGPFAAALTEYIRWRNDAGIVPYALEIRPFLDFLGIPAQARYPYLEQFELFMAEGGRGRRLTAPAADRIIRDGLRILRAYMQPAVPDTPRDSADLTEPEWWLRLSVLLDDIHRNYRSLLKTEIPDRNTPAEQMFSEYRSFRTFLQEILGGTRRLLDHLRAGSGRSIVWVEAEDLYEDLIGAVRGMDGLEARVVRDAQVVVADYRKRVAAPIDRYLPVIDLLARYPVETWLADRLSDAFGVEHMGISHDFGIGHTLFGLLEDVNDFSLFLQHYYDRLGSWQENLPSRINHVNYTSPPLHGIEFGEETHDIKSRLRSLKELALPPADAPANGAAPGAASSNGALPPAEEADEQEAERKRALAGFWRIGELLEDIDNWHAVQNRLKMNAQSLYLRELFQRADFRQNIPGVDRWRGIKSIEMFQEGNGIELVAPVDVFLAKWLGDIPQPIRSLGEAEDGAPKETYPEMRHFRKLMEEVTLFRTRYMQPLRAAANRFAECVQSMDADTAAAWRTLRESSRYDDATNQPVSWKHLLSFSNFKKTLETESGPIVRTVTEQLLEIESHVFQVYKADLLATYAAMENRLIEKYEEKKIGEKFPFRKDGDPANSAMLLALLEDAGTLRARFELDGGIYVAAADGKKTPVSRLSRDILEEMVGVRQRRFFEDLERFGAFLFEERRPRSHEVAASVVPGQVGAYFHWLRLVFGSGRVTDLNVYGDPVKEMTVPPENGSLAVHGLDAARMPQASVLLTRGDFAFLQAAYLFGRPEDPARTVWAVEIDIPMSINPAFVVGAEFRFTFKEGLPPLPDWTDMHRKGP